MATINNMLDGFIEHIKQYNKSKTEIRAYIRTYIKGFSRDEPGLEKLHEEVQLFLEEDADKKKLWELLWVKNEVPALEDNFKILEEVMAEELQKLKAKDTIFEDLIINHDPVSLCNTLEPLYKGAKGKKAATILMALAEKRYILLPEHGKEKIYQAINKRFNISVDNRGYQRYIQGTKKTEHLSDDEIGQITELL